jgi:hypothetical protein
MHYGYVPDVALLGYRLTGSPFISHLFLTGCAKSTHRKRERVGERSNVIIIIARTFSDRPYRLVSLTQKCATGFFLKKRLHSKKRITEKVRPLIKTRVPISRLLFDSVYDLRLQENRPIRTGNQLFFFFLFFSLSDCEAASDARENNGRHQNMTTRYLSIHPT